MTSITDGASFHTEFVYDGLGRLRVRREYPGGSGGSGAMRAAALPMITNQTVSPILRNDVSGWVGLRLQVGSRTWQVFETSALPLRRSTNARLFAPDEREKSIERFDESILLCGEDTFAGAMRRIAHFAARTSHFGFTHPFASSAPWR